jgi:hypothetical protein
LEKLKTPGKVRRLAEARAIVAAIVQKSSLLRLTDLAKLLGRDVSALGKVAQRAVEDERISCLVTEVEEVLCDEGQMSETLT